MTSVADPAVQTDQLHLTAPVVAPRALSDTFVGSKYVQLVLVLGLLSAIGPLTVDMYLPALPELTTQLHATDAQAQTTITGLLIGLGLGQLVIGPLSDAVGRRKPLLMGLAGHGLMSVLCAIAPSITMLTVTRSLQGVAGAAVAVVAMAIVRDLFTGIRAAQLLSRLVLVMGVAPILAPSLGSALLKVTSWHGIFIVLAAAAALLLALAFFALPETLPSWRRRSARPVESLKAYASMFSDKMFVVMVVVAGLMFATIFAYVSGSPFILQHLYGLNPQQFGLAFGGNAFGMIVATQINPVLVQRFGPVKVLTAAVVGSALMALTLVLTTSTGFGGMAGFMVPLWFLVALAGLSFPNAPAIALNRHGEAAGTAAALLGSAQFLIGGLTAPLVGVLDNGTPVPMAGIMLATTGISAVLLLATRRRLSAFSFDD
ncbi:multidrug effflux MFS transporter [Microlunatus panaciterrae]|uniref:DHA1 family bicyclomycin/chloramphenicol resistance-like MFS transporter n=1 Tax=Microlunatus panaciterrae TaxID=400768 RepID=A0ABS2RH96_9ACTN|nr:multidrug effflux MFS transporter [Microlunatus panaciterrae]MBM7797902.1 DHA1 family bicyclomycin/chloramphenicol resistance-like MFS transporter [Microlunatus panaciterrae]